MHWVEKEYQKEYMKEYRKRPEVKLKAKEYKRKPEYIMKQKVYYAKPEIKSKLKRYYKIRNQIPSVKQYRLKVQKKYMENPKVKEKRKEYFKEYEQKLEVKERRKISRKSPIRKEKIKQYKKLYMRKRKIEDKEFAIRERIRTRLRHAIIYYVKHNKYKINKETLIDYSTIIEYLKPYPEDISIYHIDHIKPLCSFDLTNEEEVKRAFAPENHQWLLAKDNIIKGGKWKNEE